MSGSFSFLALTSPTTADTEPTSSSTMTDTVESMTTQSAATATPAVETSSATQAAQRESLSEGPASGTFNPSGRKPVGRRSVTSAKDAQERQALLFSVAAGIHGGL